METPRERRWLRCAHQPVFTRPHTSHREVFPVPLTSEALKQGIYGFTPDNDMTG